MIRRLLLWVGLLSPVWVLQAQVSLLQWQSQTSVRAVTDLCYSGDWVWAATPGGLWGIHDVTREQAILTNTEGLASNDVSCVTADGQGGIWLGTANGMIQRYSPSDGKWQRISDYESHTIHALRRTGDTLWVGLDVGISLYRLDRGEVKETYRRLGSLPVDQPVQDMVVTGTKIWVATAQGVSVAPLLAANLLDPASWATYTEAEGLLDSDIQALSTQGETVYAAGAGGASAFENGAWTPLFTSEVRDLILAEGVLHVATASGVYARQGAGWVRLGTSLSFEHLISGGGRLYAGGTKVLRVFDTGAEDWAILDNVSLSGNLISGSALDGKGRLWCATRDGGLSRLHEDGTWEVLDQTTVSGLSTHDWISITADEQGRIWAGSWGKGLVRVYPDNSFTFYRPDNSDLAGISEDPNYAVITGLLKDAQGTLWVLNYRAIDGYALVAIDTSGQWARYGRPQGLESALVRTLCEDVFGRKWIGTEAGLYMLDDRGTPSDPSDDPDMDFYGMDHGLPNADVRALAATDDGIVYVGTGSGLCSVLDGRITQEYGTPSESITALLVDGADNLWIGTREGVALRKRSSLDWRLYGTEDGLAHNFVNALSMDYGRGFLYIGTNGGLSVLQTPYASPSRKMTSLQAYPNPFRPAVDIQVAIDGLGESVSAAIFTAGGWKVKTIDASEIEGRRLLWDGKDDQGQPLPSGIYVVVGKNTQGDRQTGKLTLIR